MKISKSEFGKVNGEIVYLFSLENDNGIRTSITNYGGIMTTLFVPDKKGTIEDVILGFDNFNSYLKENPCFGVIIGRYANRIAKGTFKIDNETYKLSLNYGTNHLHGGFKGFDKVVWNTEELKNNNEVGLKLSYVSKDMEEGYPGNLAVEVIYSLNNNNEIKIEYFATTDKMTHVNLTQHNYYNLSACKTDIREHLLTLNTAKYTLVNDELIPTGELANVSGTPLDFLKGKKIGQALDQIDGIDHNFVQVDYDGSLKLIAKAEEPISGRVMEVFTTQPGIQIFTGNFLDGSLTGKYGLKYRKHDGFCIESQHFPDSPNHPHFPSTILVPGQKYHESTIFKFSVI